MARLLASTDSITVPQNQLTGGVISFWMKTTQTTSLVEFVSHHDATASRNGYGVILNDTGFPGKLKVYGTNTAEIFGIRGTSVVNDGNWHHVGINLWYNALANAQQLYIDGVLEAQGTSSSASWGGSTQPFRVGKSNDTFWAGYVGQLAEVAVWGGGLQTIQFTAEQFAALAKGFAPDRVWRGGSAGGFHIYMPLVRSVQCKVSEQGTPTATGTSVSDHCRVIGSVGP